MRAAAQAERSRQTALRRNAAAELRYARQLERQAKADERDAARQYLEDRIEEADDLTSEIQQRDASIASLLGRALSSPTVFSFEEMYEKYVPTPFDATYWQSREPLLEHFLPKRPGLLIRLLSKKYANALSMAKKEHETAKFDHAENTQRARLKYAETEELKRERVVEFNVNVQATATAFSQGEHDAIILYYKNLLAKSFVEDIDAVSAEVGYSPESRQLVVDLELPPLDVISEETAFKYVKSNDTVKPVLRNPAKRRSI